MNTAQLNIDPEIGNAVAEDCPKSSYMSSNNRINHPGLPEGIRGTLC